ncbi:Nuclear transcription factor Y subunit B-3 [Dorcoceras hygrometricum]|uniref:Nuclear transcription factor Y subunit B-3 n=1 Tax=Dorcoceras hygrometricum TaxID=472368 RepID=A0A2Z7BNI8_9LAMI|nr:Nuclear transcription factor Y subunit B-3 [Dorcoceras hygrometricum]
MADSDNESYGNKDGNSQSDSSQRELDRFLPIANVSRIMKKALPANAKISKDAKETVQECVSEFISFITGEASDKCQREKRKTINGDDLLWAMTTLGFEDYVEPLKVYLQRFRDTEGEKTAMAGRGGEQDSGGTAGTGGGYDYEGAYGMMGGHQGPVYGYRPGGGSGYHVGSGSSAPGGRPR